MSEIETTTIAIVGGGASGVILTNHLLQSDRDDLRIVLIEQNNEAGLGLAYGTNQPEHILNVQAARMSALETRPDDFIDWLRDHGYDDVDLPTRYMPRMLYGNYLKSIIERHKADPRFCIFKAKCVAIKENDTQAELIFDDGTKMGATFVVLATGHDETPSPAFKHSVKLGRAGDNSRPYDGDTLIVGTGLSMIDTWLELESRSQAGVIRAVSRRGLTPLSHGPTKPTPLEDDEIPFGAPLSAIMRWLRTKASLHMENGGSWRDVVDGLRPFTQRLWKSLSIADRNRFLRHGKPYWDAHRHRLAPQLRDRLDAAIASGRVELIAAKLGEISPGANGYEVALRRRGATRAEKIDAGRIYDCSGIIRNLGQSPNPVMRHLIETGMAKPDEVPIGLALSKDDSLLNHGNTSSRRLFAIGPLARASYFEIDSVPDIRPQCEALARRLL
ncbi:FAD/NAD(P)-binding protein [Limoniibacter endophyticus]|uniref:FAD-dependent oxidoreductase n=1 Tax=Limoniibacter endophyticus TaxID=1565040 RepID=A0A8J3DJ60_9HYPH|nr:FAD/NAD(P)-binding protein [Limoniibacter endophyticus]GHC73603.1 FAD-dependent oxidoreductase [Limoniibacter endophyticus]